jgi:hypothetical protein
VLMAIAFSSCLKLEDDTVYVRDYKRMATVTTGGVNPVFCKDDSVFLTLEVAQPADTFVVGERYFLHFIYGDTTNHPKNSYPVKLYGYGKTTIKNLEVLPKDSTDKWGNQFITMLDIWYSGHYCNFFLASYMGMSTPNTLELVRIKEGESTTPTDTVPKLNFELRHNVASISLAIYYYRFLSFNLSSLSTEFPNAKRFAIDLSWKEMNKGTLTFRGIYTPNQIFPDSPNLSPKTNQAAFSLTPL